MNEIEERLKVLENRTLAIIDNLARLYERIQKLEDKLRGG